MTLVIRGGTILNGVTETPITGHSLIIDKGVIQEIRADSSCPTLRNAEVTDARGKYVIPGLMNANVHLLIDVRLENLVRFERQYEELITEAAQVALRSGFTTVFDTWGPRQCLLRVRDRIRSGELIGARLFVAGNIIGLGGPFSEDFFPAAGQVASAPLIKRVNSLWAENVGPELTWMNPDQVRRKIRSYIETGIDFVKYASSEHRVPIGSSAFLVFSPASQQAIVDEAHRHGLTAQAHTQSVEALRIAVEAGADIIQHVNITGPTPIPQSTLDLLNTRSTACTIFPLTTRRYEFLKENGDVITQRLFTEATVSTNIDNLIRSRAKLLLATDAGMFASDIAGDSCLGSVYGGEDNLFDLAEGHLSWMKAMEERGFPAIDILRAATYNIASAYKVDHLLGTLEPGKLADLVVLRRDPLQSADHYRDIDLVFKEGVRVDTARLPITPRLTTRTPTTPAAVAKRI